MFCTSFSLNFLILSDGCFQFPVSSIHVRKLTPVLSHGVVVDAIDARAANQVLHTYSAMHVTTIKWQSCG